MFQLQLFWRLNAHVALIPFHSLGVICFPSPYLLPEMWRGKKKNTNKKTDLKYPFVFVFPPCSSISMMHKPLCFHLHIEMHLQGQFYTLVGLQVT